MVNCCTIVILSNVLILKLFEAFNSCFSKYTNDEVNEVYFGARDINVVSDNANLFLKKSFNLSIFIVIGSLPEMH